MIHTRRTYSVSSLPGRWVLILLHIMVGFALIPRTAEAYERSQSMGLDNIVATYRKQREQIKSLLVEYDQTGAALVDRRVIYDSLRLFEFPHQAISVVIQGQRRYSKVVTDNKDVAALIGKLQADKPGLLEGVEGDLLRHIPFDDLDRLLPTIPTAPHQRILVFDGSALRERSPHALESMDNSASVYIMRDATEKPLRSVFPGTYFDYIGYGANDPNETTPSRESKSNQLPDLFEVAPFIIASTSDDVAGSPCVVVEAKGYQKLWLDGAIGFAIRKRQVYSNGDLVTEFEYDRFTEVLPGLWMPLSVTRYVIGASRTPATYRGKRLIAYKSQVRRLEANRDSHSDAFVLEPEPGSYVMDKRLVPLDTADNPISVPPRNGVQPVVSYIQPADKSDLEVVIRDARRELGNLAPPGNRSRWSASIYIAIVSGIGMLLLLMRMRRRRLPVRS